MPIRVTTILIVAAIITHFHTHRHAVIIAHAAFTIFTMLIDLRCQLRHASMRGERRSEI